MTRGRPCDACDRFFDRTPILFCEQVSSCTNTLHFDELSIHFCPLQFELSPGHFVRFLEIDARPSGSWL